MGPLDLQSSALTTWPPSRLPWCRSISHEASLLSCDTVHAPAVDMLWTRAWAGVSLMAVHSSRHLLSEARLVWEWEKAAQTVKLVL